MKIEYRQGFKPIKENQVIRVFWNLTKKTFSIQAQLRNSNCKLVWYTVGYCDAVSLVDCTFKVQEAGRLRTIREGKKYIHAWIYGLVGDNFLIENESKVYYNPFLFSKFQCNGQDILKSNHVSMKNIGNKPVVTI